MPAFPRAAESAPPALGPVPPDRQAMTIDEHLQGALALIGEDRQLTPDEMRSVLAFQQGLKMISEGRMMQGRPLGEPEPGPQPFEQGAEEPYGTGFGEEKYPAEQGVI